MSNSTLPGDHHAKLAEMRKDYERIQNAVQSMSEHVNRLEDGTFELAVSACPENIDSAIYEKIVSGMNETNSLIKQNILKPADVNVHSHFMPLEKSVEDPGTVSVFAESGGVNKIQLNWWGGFELYLSNETTNQILALLAAGAAVEGIIAAIASAIPGAQGAAALGGVVAGLLSLGAGVLAFVNASGKGIIVYFAWGIPYWICSQ